MRAEFAQRQKILQDGLDAARAAKDAEKARRTQNMFVARSGGGGEQEPT